MNKITIQENKLYEIINEIKKIKNNPNKYENYMFIEYPIVNNDFEIDSILKVELNVVDLMLKINEVNKMEGYRYKVDESKFVYYSEILDLELIKRLTDMDNSITIKKHTFTPEQIKEFEFNEVK